MNAHILHTMEQKLYTDHAHTALYSHMNIKGHTDGDNYLYYKGHRKSFDVNKETTLWSRKWWSVY